MVFLARQLQYLSTAQHDWHQCTCLCPGNPKALWAETTAKLPRRQNTAAGTLAMTKNARTNCTQMPRFAAESQRLNMGLSVFYKIYSESPS